MNFKDIIVSGDGNKLKIICGHFNFRYIIFFLAFCIMFFFAFQTLGPSVNVGSLIVFLILIFPAYLMLVNAFNKTIIEVTDRKLLVKHGPLLMPGDKNYDINLSDLKNILSIQKIHNPPGRKAGGRKAIPHYMLFIELKNGKLLGLDYYTYTDRGETMGEHMIKADHSGEHMIKKNKDIYLRDIIKEHAGIKTETPENLTWYPINKFDLWNSTAYYPGAYEKLKHLSGKRLIREEFVASLEKAELQGKDINFILDTMPQERL